MPPPVQPDAETRLSVVVVAYNSAAALTATLPPLVAQLGPRDELVVVDNDSGDATLAVVRELAPGGRRAPDRAQRRLRGGRERGRGRGERRAAAVPQPRRASGSGIRRGDRRPAARRPRLGGMDGPRDGGGGARGEHERRRGALHRDRVGRRGGRAGARLAGRRARGRVPVRRLPRRPARGVGARRRLPRELLHVLRGRRPLAPHPPRGRAPRGRAVRRRRSRLRVREGAGEVAAARAQPLGDGPPLLSRPAADRARARAARHRARAARRGGVRRVAAAEAPRHGRGAAPAAGAAARAPRDPGDPRDPRGEFARWLTPDLDSAYLGRAGRLAPLRWALRAYWRAARSAAGERPLR